MWRYCSSFISFFFLLFSRFLTCVLHLTGPSEGEEEAAWGFEALKESVRSEHNRAAEVNERTGEQLALARLIRRGADRDLVQALKSVQGLTAKLSTTEENWNNL